MKYSTMNIKFQVVSSEKKKYLKYFGDQFIDRLNAKLK